MGLTTDVLVVGGGPAGLAAAIAARRKGFSVSVVDGGKPPIDKACGEGLLPGTLAVLRELGISIQGRDGESFQSIRFIDGNISATGISRATAESACGEPFCIRKWALAPKNAGSSCCGMRL